MSGYTPTTDEIRNVWGEFSEYGGLTNRTSGGSLIDARYAEFDRWLATHDRDIQAQALRDAALELNLPGSNATGLYAGHHASGYNEADHDAEIWLTERAADLATEGRVRLMTVPHDGHEPEAACPACPHGRGGEGA